MMLTVADALNAVLHRAGPLPPRRFGLAEALGCILAEDVVADRDWPPFDKALMDGYAVRTADLTEVGQTLRIGEEITAGRVPSRPLAVGEAALVMTGAPMPEGADAVVMIEQAKVGDDGLVRFDGPLIAAGKNVMPLGLEMRAGDALLRRGDRLNAARLGLLASVGKAEVLVAPRPRIAIVPTGDELVEPDQEPGPGQIRNSNGTLLQALAQGSDARAELLPIAPDEIDGLQALLKRGLAADVLLTTGGVSAGNRDLVPDSLAALGVERVFHKVRLKPGKPIWFGVGPRRDDGSPGPLVFGLPGNPVSGLVGFLLFVRPALAVLRGRETAMAPLPRYRLALGFEHKGDRPTYHPARLVAGPDGQEVEPLAWAGSSDLRTVTKADGFVVFPAGDRSYSLREQVEFLPF
ncbi:MAG: gephyrin-like molybdotransferase Glp [Isosphaeraceae bacterium]